MQPIIKSNINKFLEQYQNIINFKKEEDLEIEMNVEEDIIYCNEQRLSNYQKIAANVKVIENVVGETTSKSENIKKMYF